MNKTHDKGHEAHHHAKHHVKHEAVEPVKHEAVEPVSETPQPGTPAATGVAGGSAIQGNRNAPPVPEIPGGSEMDKARVEAFNKGKEERVHEAEVNLEAAKNG